MKFLNISVSAVFLTVFFLNAFSYTGISFYNQSQNKDDIMQGSIKTNTGVIYNTKFLKQNEKDVIPNEALGLPSNNSYWVNIMVTNSNQARNCSSNFTVSDSSGSGQINLQRVYDCDNPNEASYLVLAQGSTPGWIYVGLPSSSK